MNNYIYKSTKLDILLLDNFKTKKEAVEYMVKNYPKKNYLNPYNYYQLKLKTLFYNSKYDIKFYLDKKDYVEKINYENFITIEKNSFVLIIESSYIKYRIIIKQRHINNETINDNEKIIHSIKEDILFKMFENRLRENNELDTIKSHKLYNDNKKLGDDIYNNIYQTYMKVVDHITKVKKSNYKRNETIHNKEMSEFFIFIEPFWITTNVRIRYPNLRKKSKEDLLNFLIKRKENINDNYSSSFLTRFNIEDLEHFIFKVYPYDNKEYIFHIPFHPIYNSTYKIKEGFYKFSKFNNDTAVLTENQNTYRSIIRKHKIKNILKTL